MFKSFIKGNVAIQLLFIALASLFFATLQVSKNSTPFTLTDGGSIYYAFISLIDHSPLIVRILSITLIISYGYFFNEILKVYQLIPRRNYLVFFIWIILMGAFPDQWVLSPQLVSTFFILMSIYTLFKVNGQDKEDLPGLMNYALLTGIASLFYRPLIWFIVLLIISLLIIRQMNFRNLLIVLSGFLLPWVYLLVAAFFNNSITQFLHNTWLDFSIFKFHALDAVDLKHIVLLGILALLFIYSFIISIQNVQNKLIHIRSGHSIIILLFLVSLLNVFGVSKGNSQWITLILLPASAIFALHFNDLKKTFVMDMVWVALMVGFVIINII